MTHLRGSGFCEAVPLCNSIAPITDLTGAGRSLYPLGVFVARRPTRRGPVLCRVIGVNHPPPPRIRPGTTLSSDLALSCGVRDPLSVYTLDSPHEWRCIVSSNTTCRYRTEFFSRGSDRSCSFRCQPAATPIQKYPLRRRIRLLCRTAAPLMIEVREISPVRFTFWAADFSLGKDCR